MAAAEELPQSIQAPSSTHPGTTYLVREIPHSAQKVTHKNNQTEDLDAKTTKKPFAAALAKPASTVAKVTAVPSKGSAGGKSAVAAGAAGKAGATKKKGAAIAAPLEKNYLDSW